MNQGTSSPMMEKISSKQRRILLRKSLALVPRSERNWLIICCVFGTAFSLMTPLLIGTALEQVLRTSAAPGLPGGPANPFMRTCALLLVVFLLSALLGFLQGRIGAHVAQKLALRLRSEMFERMMHSPLYFLDTHKHGDLMSRVLNDVENLSSLLPQILCSLLSAGLSIGTCIVLIYLVSPALAFANIVTVVLSLLATSILSRKIFEAAIHQQSALGQTNAQVTDSIADHVSLRMLKKKKSLFLALEKDSDHLTATSFKLQFLRGLQNPLMMVFGNISFLSAIYIGCTQIASGALQIGALQSCILYSRQFVKSINDTSDLWGRLQVSLASAARIFEITTLQPEETTTGLCRDDLTGDITFEDICFSYSKRKPVFTNLNITLPMGTTTALVGSTGAGKTTVTNLLLRFYQPDSGVIRIGGIDLRQIDLAHLRASIGIVLQESMIIEGTVYDNIMYGCPAPSMEKCIHAAKLAHLHEKILQLPWQYHTPLTDESCKWSVGEKQLLGIARIIALDPQIIIVDEAMSSIDPLTEVDVNQALKTMMQGRTSIVIAHRLSTIREADKIIVLADGGVVEEGTHQQLEANHAQYNRLYSLLRE